MKGKWCEFEKLGMKVTSLYTYDGFSRDVLLKLKDGHDQWLNEVFLSPFLLKFYLKYRSHVIVYVPSHTSVTKERGYIPNREILSTQNLTVYDDVFIKKQAYKQSTMHRDVRDNVHSVIELQNTQRIKNKKVLLFDDLCTTGNSLKACFDLIEPFCLSIEVFALFHHEM